jgi:cytidylate kinase
VSAPAVIDLAARLSALAIVRERMRTLQRAAGAVGGVVMEGRDIGTVIFPDAEFKFYLTADVTVRAARRWAELDAKGDPMSRDEVLAQLRERDRRDQERTLAPLKPAPDAIIVDSSKLDASAVVALMKKHIESGQRV